MESSALLSILLPVALGIIMFGLGLSLSAGDFSRVLIYPKAVLVGLLCQMIVLPAVCFGIAKLFNLTPEVAVGLMLLSAAPGGVTSNLFSHLAKGDVILSITLTAVSSLLCIFTLPLIVNFSMQVFMDESKYIPLQFSKVLQIFAIILLPVSAGMILHRKNFSLAKKLQKPVKIFSLLFLVVLILTQVIKEWGNLASYWQQTGTAVLIVSLLSMAIGFFIPLVFSISKKQSIAISMGAGIRNGALAITIAMSPSLLNNSTISIPAALYSVVMYFTASLFAYIVSKKLKQKVTDLSPAA
ncbi:MAG TPA: bile acid:sodium symporter family protein [Chitinophagaceae bacterium]|nr:bile acid:sodium symporter family protein [Chitinophagaceae bacterium]